MKVSRVNIFGLTNFLTKMVKSDSELPNTEVFKQRPLNAGKWISKLERVVVREGRYG